jgi:hypothetical protein
MGKRYRAIKAWGRSIVEKWKVLDTDHLSKTGKIRYQYEGTLSDIIDNIIKEHES